MRLENSFTVDATPEQAWALLMDVPRVVPCMPCATLDAAGVADARHGRPIALQRVLHNAPSDHEAPLEPVLVCDEAERPVAVARLEDGFLRVVRGLLPQSDSR